MTSVSAVSLIVASLFLLLGGLCVLAVVAQLPGTWVLLALAALIEWGDQLWRPASDPTTFDTRLLIACLVLALVGELLEFVAAAVGLRRGGGSRAGLWGSFLGGFLGIFLFTPLLAFLPVLGTFLGVLLGTFGGALVGEFWHQRRQGPGAPVVGHARAALRPASWAAVGRILGTTGKVAVAVAMWLALAVSAFWG
jgi:uncharacterized protein YqgC (DUF456 family)